MTLLTKQLTDTLESFLRPYKEKQNRQADRIEKLESALLDYAKNAPVTRYGAYLGDIDAKEGLSELKEKGCTTLEGFKTAPTKGLSKDARDCMRLADTIYIADALAKTSSQFRSESQFPGYHEMPVELRLKKWMPELYHKWKPVADHLKVTTLTSTTAGTGDEWVPTGFGATLFDDIRQRCPELDIFPTVNMPTNPWVYPAKSTVGGAVLRTEGTAPTASVLGTSSVTFTCKTFVSYQEFTDEMDQDSIIAVADAVRADIIRSLAEGLSRAVVSGDTTATHMDGYFQAIAGTTADACDGLRHYGLVDVTTSQVDGGTNAITVADIAAAIKLMGAHAASRLQDVYLLIGPGCWLDLLTETELETVDKYGQGGTNEATIRSGRLPKIYGVQPILCFGVAELEGELSTSGYWVDTTTATGSCAILVNPDAWRIGDRQDVRIESDRNIAAGETLLVGTARWAFQKMVNAAGKNHTVNIFNVL